MKLKTIQNSIKGKSIKRCMLNALIGFVLAYIMFASFGIAVLTAMIFFVVSLFNTDIDKTKRDREMSERFYDFLICLQPVLGSAGTISNAFTKAAQDYRNMHGSDQIYGWIFSITGKFGINKPTEKILYELAQKIDIEDAYIFARSIAICEETGGNIKEITTRTINILAGKMRIEKKINVLLAGKKLEQKIITAAPFALLLLLYITTKSYLEPLYTTVAGRIVMIIAGILFICEGLLCKKVMDIEV